MGHALIFMILTINTKRIIHQSVIQTATNPSSENLRAINPLDQDPVGHIQSYIDDNAQEDDAL